MAKRNEKQEVLQRIIEKCNSFSVAVLNPVFKERSDGNYIITGTTVLDTPVQLLMPEGKSSDGPIKDFIKKHDLEDRDFIIFQGVIGSIGGKMVMVATGINDIIIIPKEIMQFITEHILDDMKKEVVL